MDEKELLSQNYYPPRIIATEVYLEHVIAGSPTTTPGGGSENFGQANSHEGMDYADEDYIFE